MNAASTIRQKIAAGVLPCETCQVVWAGRGTGSMCIACDRTITPEDVEYECEHGPGRTIHFHHECYVVWETVCRERESGGVVS